MTGIFEQGAGGVDLAAVARDAELMDRLAVRAPLAVDDDVARLLASLAAEVDDGLDALLAEIEAPLLEQDDSTATVGTPGLRQAHGLRATTVAIVVGATLSVSGVAAAVTGDPLAPYKGIVRAVTNAGAPSPHASTTAKLNHLATGTQAKIAHGDLAGARTDIAALQAAIADPSISEHDKALLQTRLRNLMRSLANAEAGPNSQATAKGPHSTKSPKAQASGKPSHQPTHQPQGSGSTAKPSATPGEKANGTGNGGNGSGTVQPTPVTTPDPDATAATDGGGNGGSTGGGSPKASNTPRARVSDTSTATDTTMHGRSST
ncbi:MAG TPA: hypothetical protein VH857_08145 [Actinomycetes bacterium]|jgi:hypothetical protein|nr:hypothetical protein [Actinomycetes bacterium]